jgi:hypothetical protein
MAQFKLSVCSVCLQTQIQECLLFDYHFCFDMARDSPIRRRADAA